MVPTCSTCLARSPTAVPWRPPSRRPCRAPASASNSSRAICRSRPRSTTTASRRSIRPLLRRSPWGSPRPSRSFGRLPGRTPRPGRPWDRASRSFELRSIVADAPTDDRRRGPAVLVLLLRVRTAGVAPQPTLHAVAAMSAEGRRPVRWGLRGTGNITPRSASGLVERARQVGDEVADILDPD